MQQLGGVGDVDARGQARLDIEVMNDLVGPDAYAAIAVSDDGCVPADIRLDLQARFFGGLDELRLAADGCLGMSSGTYSIMRGG